MRKIVEKLTGAGQASLAVTLEYSERQKSRGLLRLDDGSEAALLLERGSGLRHGDRLLADDGAIVRVQAALEGLSVVTAPDPLDLARAAYHLGNRHVAVQIEALRLAYLRDHVLDDMLRELGFKVAFAAARFEPESGAYGHGHAHVEQPRSAPSRAHGHAHSHGPADKHSHDSADEHEHEHAS